MMTTLMRPGLVLLLALLAALIMVLLGVAGAWDYEDAEHQEALYCDMVHKYIQNHSQGWPDYDGDYSRRCVKGRVRSQHH